MKNALILLGALLAACTTPAGPAAESPAAGVASATAVSSPELQTIGARGREIYLRDQSAWGATDAMLAAIDDPAGAGIRGWVTQPADAGRYRTIFVAERDGALYPVYEAVTDGRNVVEERIAPADAPPLSEPLAQQRHAIDAAIASGPDGFCGPNLNSVAIPIGDPAAPEAFDVYLLSASTEQVIPAGGHVRLRVDADDYSVVEQEQFSTSCMTLDIKPNVAAYVLTSNVGEMPSEAHVFLSLTFETPLAVVTSVNGQTWMVEGSRIAPLEEAASK